MLSFSQNTTGGKFLAIRDFLENIFGSIPDDNAYLQVILLGYFVHHLDDRLLTLALHFLDTALQLFFCFWKHWFVSFSLFI